MTRKELLEGLISGKGEPEYWTNQLQGFVYDSEELVWIGPNHIGMVLNRFLKGDIGPTWIERWAEAIECRDDVGFLSHPIDLQEVIFELANPTLNGKITLERAQFLSAALTE